MNEDFQTNSGLMRCHAFKLKAFNIHTSSIIHGMNAAEWENVQSRVTETMRCKKTQLEKSNHSLMLWAFFFWIASKQFHVTWLVDSARSFSVCFIDMHLKFAYY